MFGIRSYDAAAQRVTTARAELARHLAEDRNHDIAQMTNEIAFWEGYAATFGEYERNEAGLKADGIGGMRLHFALMQGVAEMLSRGADDDWSGRGNDYARRRFDGVRNAARMLTGRLEVEVELNEIIAGNA